MLSSFKISIMMKRLENCGFTFFLVQVDVKIQKIRPSDNRSIIAALAEHLVRTHRPHIVTRNVTNGGNKLSSRKVLNPQFLLKFNGVSSIIFVWKLTCSFHILCFPSVVCFSHSCLPQSLLDQSRIQSQMMCFYWDLTTWLLLTIVLPWLGIINMDMETNTFNFSFCWKKYLPVDDELSAKCAVGDTVKNLDWSWSKWAVFKYSQTLFGFSTLPFSPIFKIRWSLH